MLFLFYFCPLFTCIGAGVMFFTGEKKNIAGGILMVLFGLVPVVNIPLAFAGLVFLMIKALK